MGIPNRRDPLTTCTDIFEASSGDCPHRPDADRADAQSVNKLAATAGALWRAWQSAANSLAVLR